MRRRLAIAPSTSWRGHAAHIGRLDIGHRNVAGTVDEIVVGEIGFAGHTYRQPVSGADSIALVVLISCGRTLGAIGWLDAIRRARRQVGDAGDGARSLRDGAVGHDAHSTACGFGRIGLPGLRAAGEQEGQDDESEETHTHEKSTP